MFPYFDIVQNKSIPRKQRRQESRQSRRLARKIKDRQKGGRN